MKQINDVLKPVEKYEEVKETFAQNTKEYFDNMVKKSKINKDQNKKTCDEYYSKVNEKEKKQKKQSSSKGLKGFLIFLAVVFYLAMVIGILMLALKWVSELLIPIILIVCGALLGTGMVLIICLVLNKKIKSLQYIIEELDKKIEKLNNEAWDQLKPLNDLLTWGMPQSLITQTIPLINMDRILTPGRSEQLFDKYGYPLADNNTSVVMVQSGSILGNPFMVEKVLYTYMGTQVYTGSIVISWTTYERDANGHSVTRHHTQTLTATVTKPKPFYNFDTRLVYGNDAAPNLSFTRESTNKNLGEMSDRQIRKMVKKSDKKLQKLAKKDGTFTQMGNSEFEALFTTTDRTNETEYRLLFTPIAQQNMVELLKSKPYGDDFSFVKEGPINIVRSEHSQNFDYQASPSEFANFDFEAMEQHFNEYCNTYFQSMYFDLAPILSIPLYQQHKAREYIYKTSDGVTNSEIECLINGFGWEKFAHPSTVTDCIIKCKKNTNSNAGIKAVIDCYSYKTIQHTTLVPVVGGDGRRHNVPVVWYEYIPLLKSTPISVLDAQGYAEEHEKQTVDSISKKFGIKGIYGQKGIIFDL